MTAVQDFSIAGCGPNDGQANCDFNDDMYIFCNIIPSSNTALNPWQLFKRPGDPTLILPFPTNNNNNNNNNNNGGLVDSNGKSTGFYTTITNDLDITIGSNSYQPNLLTITNSGLTIMTTATSNEGNISNTLVNSLVVGFDGSSDIFSITTTLSIPIGSNANAGIIFGYDKDDFASFALIYKNDNTATLRIYLEKDNGQPITPIIVQIDSSIDLTKVTSFSLFLIANPNTQSFTTAYQAIYSQTSSSSKIFIIPQTISVEGTSFGRFFDANSKAGIFAVSTNANPSVAVTFKGFSITIGDVTNTDSNCANIQFQDIIITTPSGFIIGTPPNNNNNNNNNDNNSTLGNPENPSTSESNSPNNINTNTPNDQKENDFVPTNSMRSIINDVGLINIILFTFSIIYLFLTL